MASVGEEVKTTLGPVASVGEELEVTDYSGTSGISGGGTDYSGASGISGGGGD